MSDDTVGEVKNRLDVVAVLKKYLELSSAGKNFKAKCPFHGDNSPSLMVSPERQSWYCFGCGAGGDIFSFVMRYENLEFFEALKMLAEQAGVPVRQLDPALGKQFEVLYEINQVASDFWQKKLREEIGAQDYLKSRGVTGKTAKEWELGVAGGEWDGMVKYLVNKGFTLEEAVRSGLVIKSEEKGKYFDRWRNRIMFPIHNHSGKVVAFTGRIRPEFEAEEKMGKYVNSPETPIFSKSKILYGFFKNKAEIREAGEAVVMEGQMDVIMSWQDGVRNVVAASGTALTREHLTALARMTDKITLLFDSDEAGQLAGERAIDEVTDFDVTVKVLVLQEVKDPAELVTKEPGRLVKEIKKAVLAMEFYFDRWLPLEATASALKKGVRKVFGKIKRIPSAVEREVWLRRLAKRTGLSEVTLVEEMDELTIEKRVDKINNEEERVTVSDLEKTFNKEDRLSQRILSAGLVGGGELSKNIIEDEFLTDKFKKVAEILKEGKRETNNPITDQLLMFVILKSGLEEEEDTEELKKRLKIEVWRRRKKEYQEAIRRQERLKGQDKEEMKALMDKLQETSQQLSLLLNS